jgi:multimeric flavodoxin WrbA
MITILADEGENKTGFKLYQAFLSKGVQADYVPLNDVTVKPCAGCNGCTYKTYGKCVVRDDGDWIYGKILRSDAVFVVSPILFGGYTVRTKRVLDKFGLLMDRHYYVAGGEMTKGGWKDRQFKLFALGIQEEDDPMEAEAFKNLVHETNVIVRGGGKAYTTGPSLPNELALEIVREVAKV